MFKKYVNKQTVIAFVLGALLFSGIPVFGDVAQYIFTQSNCKLIVDGQEYANPDIPINLFMKDNSNYAPVAVIRDICTKLNIPFEYNNVTKEIRITTIGKEVNVLSETITPTETTAPNFITYEEDGLTIVEVNSEKYVEVFSIMQKIQNTDYKLVYDGIDVFSLRKSDKIISKDIATYNQVNTKGIFPNSKKYFKYNDYLEKVKSFIE